MLSIDDIKAAYKVLFLRDPEDGIILEWQRIFKGFREFRLALLSSEEFNIVQDRERRELGLAARISSERADNITSKIFIIPQGTSSGTVPPSLARVLDGIASGARPRSILVLGGPEEENVALALADKCEVRPVIISNAPGQAPGVAKLGLQAAALMNVLAVLKIGFDIIVSCADQDEHSVRDAYHSLPEKGVLICRAEENDPILGLMHQLSRGTGGEVVRVEEWAVATHALCPWPVVRETDNDSSVRHGSQRIALATIVRNEADVLPTMIRSCRVLVEHVTIVDTGSTDDTVKIAVMELENMKMSYNIESVPFKDFAQARNSAIAAVPPGFDWVIMLDADEYLMPQDAQKIIDLAESGVADMFMIPRYNYRSSDTSGAELGRYPDKQSRFFRLAANPRYHGAVHEHILIDGIIMPLPMNKISIGFGSPSPHIHHTGEMRGASRFQEKVALYDRLAAGMIKD